MSLSKEQRYNKGKDFQVFVKSLLSKSGYLEGQLYSTTGEYNEGYYEELKRLGKVAYTSPDITVLNRWDTPATELDKRFGVACSLRDAPFDSFGKSAVTFPRYQSYAHQEIEDAKGLPIYHVFGRRIDNTFAVGVTGLTEPDDIMELPDQSTGNKRWYDIFLIEKLLSWAQFIEHRILMGDHEPTIEAVTSLNVGQLR